MSEVESPALFQRRVIAAAVTAACVGAPAAQAQESLEEIIVTATKRSVNLQDVPLAVTAFTEQDIVRQGFKTLDDYYGQIPGLTFSRREPGGTTVLMRGCTISGLSFGGSSTTSIYLDEQPITAAGRNPDARLIDIERVEALSGPQGTLFGDASQCGSLRIITNKPDTSAPKGWLDANFTSVSDGDIGYGVSGMANLPLVDGKVALRLVGFHEEEAGYVDNVLSTSPGGTYDNSAFVEEDINSASNTGARAMLRTHVNDDWTVDIAGVYQKKELDGFGDTDINNGLYAGRNLGDLEQVRFNKDSWDDEWYQLSVTAEGSLGFADLVATGSFFSRETVYEADATSYQFAFDQLFDSNLYTVYDFGGDPQAFAFNKEDTDVFTAEIRLSTPAESTSRWNGIVGFFYLRDEGDTIFYSGNSDFDTSPAFYYLNYLAFSYDNSFPLPAPPSGGNWFTGVYDSTLEQMALFGEVGFEVTENFNITAGGRFFDIELDRTLTQGALFQLGTRPNCDVDFCFGGEPFLASADETGFVPKLTLDYHINDDTMVYATYSEGFRRGGANPARSTSVFGPGNPLHEYTSDELSNYELGLKGTWADGRFRLNAAYYFMVWDQIQLQFSDPNIFTLGTVNFPEAELTGIEAHFTWLPAEGWDISGTLGWNEAEISQTAVLFAGQPEEIRVVEETDLPIMPEWKGSLSVQYTFNNEVWGGTPFVRMDHTYQGEAPSSLGGLQAIIFTNPVRTLDSYNITDLRFGVDAAKWSASVFVDNVTDERAQQFFNDRWEQTRLSINRPLSFGITYRRHFN